jgi:hypothetical protein
MALTPTPKPAIEPLRTDREQNLTSATIARWTFAAVLVGALPLYLVLAHNQWFFLDDWDFLATRKAGSLDDLFRPHNEHWSTLPILEYRALFSLFGLRTYVPYQVVAVVAHLVVAALLWAVMRRAEIHPWIATAAASLFALLGAGNQNIVWAFQIGWTGSLAFGLGQLILSDHDGPIDRRDFAGLVCGAAGLLCTGVAIPMVVAVGFSVLLRRGWRAAAFHVIPLAAAFGLWWLIAGRGHYGAAQLDVGRMLSFGWSVVTNTFSKMGQLPGAGVVLALVLVAGLTMAVRDRGSDESRRRLAAPLALLLAGGGSFVLITATGRAALYRGLSGIEGRYFHVLSALTLPAIAVAADALARRWRGLLPVALALFLLAIPGNIEDLASRDEGTGAFALGNPRGLRTLPVVPLAEEVPQDLRIGDATPGVTIGWLRALVRSGDLKPFRSAPPNLVAQANTSLALQQRASGQRPGDCQTLVRPLTRTLGAGESFHLRGGPLRVQPRDAAYTSRVLDPAFSSRIEVAVPLDVTLSSVDRAQPAIVC